MRARTSRSGPTINFRSRLIGDSRGAVAIEYALLAILIAVGIVSALRSTKSGVSQQFDSASYNMNQATGGTQLAVKKVYAPTALTENGNQSAVFDIDNTLTNIIGVTTYNNDGSVAVDKRTPLYTGVAMVVHTDAAGSYTYRETQSPTGTPGVTAVTRTMLDDSGSGTFKTMQYVQDQSVAGTSTMIGSVVTNKDGTVTKSGQDISSYF